MRAGVAVILLVCLLSFLLPYVLLAAPNRNYGLTMAPDGAEDADIDLLHDAAEVSSPSASSGAAAGSTKTDARQPPAHPLKGLNEPPSGAAGAPPKPPVTFIHTRLYSGANYNVGKINNESARIPHPPVRYRYYGVHASGRIGPNSMQTLSAPRRQSSSWTPPISCVKNDHTETMIYGLVYLGRSQYAMINPFALNESSPRVGHSRGSVPPSFQTITMHSVFVTPTSKTVAVKSEGEVGVANIWRPWGVVKAAFDHAQRANTVDVGGVRYASVTLKREALFVLAVRGVERRVPTIVAQPMMSHTHINMGHYTLESMMHMHASLFAGGLVRTHGGVGTPVQSWPCVPNPLDAIPWAGAVDRYEHPPPPATKASAGDAIGPRGGGGPALRERIMSMKPEQWYGGLGGDGPVDRSRLKSAQPRRGRGLRSDDVTAEAAAMFPASKEAILELWGALRERFPHLVYATDPNKWGDMRYQFLDAHNRTPYRAWGAGFDACIDIGTFFQQHPRYRRSGPADPLRKFADALLKTDYDDDVLLPKRRAHSAFGLGTADLLTIGDVDVAPGTVVMPVMNVEWGYTSMVDWTTSTSTYFDTTAPFAEKRSADFNASGWPSCGEGCVWRPLPLTVNDIHPRTRRLLHSPGPMVGTVLTDHREAARLSVDPAVRDDAIRHHRGFVPFEDPLPPFEEMDAYAWSNGLLPQGVSSRSIVSGEFGFLPHDTEDMLPLTLVDTFLLGSPADRTISQGMLCRGPFYDQPDVASKDIAAFEGSKMVPTKLITSVTFDVLDSEPINEFFPPPPPTRSAITWTGGMNAIFERSFVRINPRPVPYPYFMYPPLPGNVANSGGQVGRQWHATIPRLCARDVTDPKAVVEFAPRPMYRPNASLEIMTNRGLTFQDRTLGAALAASKRGLISPFGVIEFKATPLRVAADRVNAADVYMELHGSSYPNTVFLPPGGTHVVLENPRSARDENTLTWEHMYFGLRRHRSLIWMTGLCDLRKTFHCNLTIPSRRFVDGLRWMNGRPPLFGTSAPQLLPPLTTTDTTACDGGFVPYACTCPPVAALVTQPEFPVLYALGRVDGSRFDYSTFGVGGTPSGSMQLKTGDWFVHPYKDEAETVDALAKEGDALWPVDPDSMMFVGLS